jgi:hypothetical protein
MGPRGLRYERAIAKHLAVNGATLKTTAQKQRLFPAYRGLPVPDKITKRLFL